jgi:hypothetical protein
MKFSDQLVHEFNQSGRNDITIKIEDFIAIIIVI